MEFNEDFIKENNLTEEQISGISNIVDEHISSLEKEWGGKANENAEGILNGVAVSVESLTGIKRERGQKYADYLKTATDVFFDNQKKVLEQKQNELENKLKNADTDGLLKKELETTKSKLTELKKKEAIFSDWEENDYKGKYETVQKELSGLKLELAYNSVKPKLQETVNEFEFKYKWDDFKARTNSKYNIEIIDNEPIAIDKENEFTKIKLSELAEKDEILGALSKPKQNRGIGAKAGSVRYEGVPFDISPEASSSEINSKIREYLVKKGIKITNRNYAEEFSNIHKAILQQKTAKD